MRIIGVSLGLPGDGERGDLDGSESSFLETD